MTITIKRPPPPSHTSGKWGPSVFLLLPTPEQGSRRKYILSPWALGKFLFVFFLNNLWLDYLHVQEPWLRRRRMDTMPTTQTRSKGQGQQRREMIAWVHWQDMSVCFLKKKNFPFTLQNVYTFITTKVMTNGHHHHHHHTPSPAPEQIDGLEIADVSQARCVIFIFYYHSTNVFNGLCIIRLRTMNDLHHHHTLTI